MEVRRPGIRAKLNLGLGVVLLVATIAFGTSYAWMERSAVLDNNRKHLGHVASLVRLHVETARGRDEIATTLGEFSRRLTEATGSQHHLTLTTEEGEVLGASEIVPPGGRVEQEGASGSSMSLEALLPASLKVTVPVTLEGYQGRETLTARLTLEEPLAELPGNVAACLLRYLGFSAGLVGLAMSCAAWLTHRLVVRPVRELARATAEIAREGGWQPFYPGARRTDEIGVLADCLAQMSRRLAETVRRERYGSAHMVAARVRRELEEPLREIEIQLAVLEKLAPAGSDEARICVEVASRVEEIAELRRRLREVPSTPRS